MKLNVAIIDDHHLFAEGLKYYLSSLDLIDEIKYYESGNHFIEVIDDIEKPDIIFMDICMPGKDGIETTREIREITTDIKIIGMSSLESVEHIEGMIEAGADGYLLKSSSLGEIEISINEVLKGNSYFSANVLATLTKRNIRRTLDAKYMIEKISEREMEVLRLVCSGHDKAKIAEILHISERTVDKHRENLMEKTGSENAIQLMIFSLKNDLVRLHA